LSRLDQDNDARAEVMTLAERELELGRSVSSHACRLAGGMGLLSILTLTGLFGLAACAASSEPADSWRVIVIPRQRIVAVIDYAIHCPDLEAREWTVFAAAAPELPGQTQVKSTLSPAGVALRERGPLGRGLLRLRWPVRTRDEAKRLAVTVTYEATLHRRSLQFGKGDAVGSSPRLSASDRERFCSERGDYDFKHPRFKQWLRDHSLLRRHGEHDVDLARRAFLTLRQLLTYDYREEMDRKASTVCFDGKSDCGGLAGILVAVLRANGIPARTLYGRWARSAVPNDRINLTPYYQWHVKAEFFAHGAGWVPVDLAAGIVLDKSQEGLRYFGHDDGDFLTLHVDSQVQIDTGAFGIQTLENLQGPAWWVQGKGSLRPTRIEQNWTVRSEPLPAAESSRK
jgi:transglutaminase-like putative cysteine protease